MIHFLLTRDHAYTLEQYLQTWGRDLRDRIAPPLCYEQLAFAPKLNPGVYIFSDLERLTPAQTELAIAVHQQLTVRPSAFKLLNDPAKVLNRYHLLRTLHAQGVNRFTARKIDDATTTLKFPVFLRNESDHKGAISPLLNDVAEADRAVADALAKGQQRDHLLLVEYVDTKDAIGIYRKYSYFRVGGRLIPRHIAHSHKWMIKYMDLIEPAFVEEELAYLQSSPHAAELEWIFNIANIDYGRIDYALIDNQIQTWEINTNPNITVTPGRVAIPRLQATGLFAAQFADAMKCLDHNPPNESPHQLKISRDLARKLKTSLAQRALRPIAGAIRWLAHHPSIDRLGR